MIGFWMIGVVSALGIGAAIGATTSWMCRKRPSPTTGLILVFMLCLGYHALAALGMGFPLLRLLTPTIIVPFGVGFGEGNGAFVVALLIQAVFAGAVGMAIYWLMNRGREREHPAGGYRR